MEKEKFKNDFNINDDNDFISKSILSYYVLESDKGGSNEKLDIVDGGNDGGIDYFLDLDDNSTYVGQSKFSVLKDKKELFNEIRKLIDNFVSIGNKNKTKKDDPVKDEICEKIKQISNKKVKFQILFIGFKNDDLNKIESQKLVDEFLKSNSTDENHKDIELIFGECLYKSLIVYSSGKSLEINSKIDFTLSYDGNKVPYSNNNIKMAGYLININAYDMYLLMLEKKEFLFDKNIRGYLNKTNKSKKVNNEMIESLENNTAFFWFVNNGIIILCENAQFDNSEINFKNMSIINGAQTVSNIYHFLNDALNEEEKAIKKNRLMSVFLACKIVILKEHDEKIINYIVQSSNTQKSVKTWTLYSNHKEVVELNNRMKRLNYFLNYKDGFLDYDPSIKNLNKDEKYKVIDLDKFVQSKICIFNLTPGYATQNKEKLFLDDSNVEKLNEKKNDIYFIMSVIKFYDKMKSDFVKMNKLWVLSFLSLILLGVYENIEKINAFNKEKIENNISKNINKCDKQINLVNKKFIKEEIKDEEISEIQKNNNFIELKNNFLKYCTDYKSAEYYSDNRFYLFIINNIELFKKFYNE